MDGQNLIDEFRNEVQLSPLKMQASYSSYLALFRNHNASKATGVRYRSQI